MKKYFTKTIILISLVFLSCTFAFRQSITKQPVFIAWTKSRSDSVITYRWHRKYDDYITIKFNQNKTYSSVLYFYLHPGKTKVMGGGMVVDDKGEWKLSNDTLFITSPKTNYKDTLICKDKLLISKDNKRHFKKI